MSNQSFNFVINSFYDNFSDSTVGNPNPFASFEVLTEYTKNLGPINYTQSNVGAVNYEFSVKIMPILLTLIDLYKLTTGLNNDIPGLLLTANDSITNLTTFITGNQKINENIKA